MSHFKISATIALFLMSVSGYGQALASLENDESNAFPDNIEAEVIKTDIVETKSVTYSKAQLEELIENHEKLERKYRVKLRRSLRWQKRSVKKLDRALEDLDTYEAKTGDWDYSLTSVFETLDPCEAQEEPIEVAKIQELHSFMWELKDYYQLISWQWNKTLNPPIGQTINASSQRIDQLLDNRSALLNVEDASAIRAIEVIDRKLSITIDKMEILYKDSLETAMNSSEVFRHLTFMHDLYPIIKSEVTDRLERETNPTEKEILQRHYAAMMYDLDAKYLESISTAREAHKNSVEFLKQQVNDAPEQILKFKAQRMQIKELKKRLYNNSETIPQSEMADSDNKL